MKRFTTLLLATALLVGCSSDRRLTREYLEAVQKDVQPALDQAKVVHELSDSMRPGNLQAGWPVVRKNLQELHQKTAAAQTQLGQLKVPPPATEVHKLVQEELVVIDEMSTKALDLGDKASNLGSGFPAVRKLAQLKPQIDELQQLQFRHRELSTKLKSSLEDLRRKQRL